MTKKIGNAAIGGRRGLTMKQAPLRWSDDFMYQAILRHDRSYDGKFLTCVLSTGIYCLPSCPARKPLLKNIRFLANEREAVDAGFRICKRCRPDLFYRGENADVRLFDAMLERLRAEPAKIKGVAALAKLCGVSSTKLNELVRHHAHLSPADLIGKERVRTAGHALLSTTENVLNVGLSVGFASEASFHRQFLAHMAMTPSTYRALSRANEFSLKLPTDYSPDGIWRYHLRDQSGLSERFENGVFTRALWLDDRPAVVTLRIGDGQAHCRWETAPSPEASASASGVEVHRQVMKLLGLHTDTGAFYAAAKQNPTLKRLADATPVLYVPLTATPFEALTWAIIGQQINLTFAAALRHDLIKLAGRQASDDGLWIHPRPSDIAVLSPESLTRIRFSRAKANYLIDAARAIADGSFDLNSLAYGSAETAEKALCQLKGVGPWTARYTMMRGLGFADSAPVGDSGLAAALVRFYALEARPNAAQAEQLMLPFTPFRTQATAHLWETLRTPYATE
ncbi:DNA-3-methyladenine glycosylase 2 [Leminorella grimontii]|uniref:DNA-3-methyladenine glycosylase 2 n=1 Tax=Leminorella grimontii TaxID=82981 RepID=UPI0021C434D5|nr:Ada metal-binding domain-containing protein [Leminorella grimontii]